jgi:hypothetical protein
MTSTRHCLVPPKTSTLDRINPINLLLFHKNMFNKVIMSQHLTHLRTPNLYRTIHFKAFTHKSIPRNRVTTLLNLDHLKITTRE